MPDVEDRCDEVENMTAEVVKRAVMKMKSNKMDISQGFSFGALPKLLPLPPGGGGPAGRQGRLEHRRRQPGADPARDHLRSAGGRQGGGAGGGGEEDPPHLEAAPRAPGQLHRRHPGGAPLQELSSLGIN